MSSNGTGRASSPASERARLRRRSTITSRLPIRLRDRVRIAAGPLAGLEGQAREWHRGRATFVVSVDLLQRSVGVEVDAALLERC